MPDAVSDTLRRALADQPVLDTERLHLRRPHAQDGASFVAILNDWDVARWLARIPHPYTMADAHFFLNDVVPHELVWAITDKQSGIVVGAVGLAAYGNRPDAVEIGYYIARAHWGRGMATEAGLAVIAYASTTFGTARLHAGYFADNPASGRVLAKLGFVATSTGVRPCLARNADMPSVEMTYAGRGQPAP